VLDLSLPDMAGFEVLKKIKRQEKYRDLPVIIYTSKDLTKQEEAQLKKYAISIITKNATSSDQLLDETALFLHRVVEKLPQPQRSIIERRRGQTIVPSRSRRRRWRRGANPELNGQLAGRKVLVVDDDVRNIFALTSALEDQGMTVLYEENGRAAIETLKSNQDIEVVLMDVMMPDMDGYETIRAMREIPEIGGVPIIAVTAKAMEGDREKSLAAGANGYITKPVDISRLFEMIGATLGGYVS
jgi:CheY-like chemotaxis protein